MTDPRMCRTSQSGFSLVAALVGIALVAIGFSIFAQTMTNHMKLTKRAHIDLDFDDLRKYVGARIDCVKTVTPLPSGCSSGGVIDARKSDGTTLFTATRTNAISNYLGEYHLRARCVTVGNQFQVIVETRRENPATGAPLNEPLSATASTWTSLFKGVPLCAPFTP